MLRDITIGRYINSDSVLHRADPRTKIIITIAFSFAVFLCNSLLSMVLALIFITASIIVAKIPIKYIIKGLKPLRWFLLLMFFVNLFSCDGNILFRWGIITISDNGLYKAILITLKFVLFTAAASLFTLTTSPVSLTDGFARLIKPLKLLRIPTDSVAMIISIMLRFIPLAADEYERISKAQKARNTAEKGIIQKIKSLSACAVPLIINTFRHTDELAAAMDARCYGIGTRKPRKKLKFSRIDFILSIFMIIFYVFLAIIEFLH